MYKIFALDKDVSMNKLKFMNKETGFRNTNLMYE